MTIKEIKEAYKRYDCSGREHNSFAVYDYKDGNGKMVIVMKHLGIYGYKDVVQAIRVSDGKEMIPEGSCRPCDNLDDAIDVAAEMMMDERRA